MELIGIFLPFAAWIPIFLIAAVLAVAVYTFAILGFGQIVEFFLGRETASDFVDRAVKPVEILWNIGNAIRAVFAIPFRIRRKTVFAAVLGFRPFGLFHQEDWDQKQVDDKLRELAVDYGQACDRQESARERLHSREISPLDMDPYDEAVEQTKTEFWTAHNLAEHLGFNVRYSHKEYLPEETPASEAASV